MFNDEVQVQYIFKAGKPKVSGYERAMELMGTDKGNTLFVGDQIFTDVYGAKRAGLRTILTRPIHPKEEIQIVLKRYLEKVVLFFYSRKQ
jgi:Predicted hydrolase of the HAD superfamily